MFVPSDPRFDEVLHLAQQAVGTGLTDLQRARWRELCTGMLGTLQAAGQQQPERRLLLRAMASLGVDILSPEELRGTRLTSTVSSGGISVVVRDEPALGTIVELSIAVNERPQPLRARAAVAWARDQQIGLAFIDLIQGDRELLEALAVRALLVYTVLE